jgi:hypothetical protein
MLCQLILPPANLNRSGPIVCRAHRRTSPLLPPQGGLKRPIEFLYITPCVTAVAYAPTEPQLAQPHHTSEFWSRVKRVMSNWEQRHRRLAERVAS